MKMGIRGHVSPDYRHEMKINPRFNALFAAALFGASAPFSKRLLEEIDPLQLAGLLYLGSGIFMLLLKGLRFAWSGKRTGDGLRKADMPWLLGIVVSGGFLAPAALMYGLATTPAATASMLLNFEAAATTVLAAFFFREHIGRRVMAALSLLTLACLVLAFDAAGRYGFPPGALLVLLACIFWGVDNNFTRHISSRDPMMIVIAKGIGAGSISLILSLLAGGRWPSLFHAAIALGLGGLSYGASLLLFIAALRDLGSARAGTLIASAPFMGAIISFMIYRHAPNVQFWISLPFMLAGIGLLFRESHVHMHRHEAMVHDHVHTHPDDHHLHGHAGKRCRWRASS